MRIEQVAVQTYTVREFCKTPTDIAESFKKISDIGYHAVQTSGLGPISNKELRQIADDQGLEICATHEPGKEILDNPEGVAEKLQELGCEYTAFPHPGDVDMTDVNAVLKLAAKLDHAGEVLAKAGKVLTYHNHACEFQLAGSDLALELIYDYTRPAYLKGEIDTYWVQYGGGDPVNWCYQLSGRLPLLHMKDYGIIDNQITFTEIGNGNLNWPAIITAAEEGGCEWYIVEQDRTPADPFDSLLDSFEFIKWGLCEI